MKRRPGFLPPACQAPVSGPAPLRRVVGTETTRIRDFDQDGEFFHEITTGHLSCGHPASGKPRKDGRYPCYQCRDEAAK